MFELNFRDERYLPLEFAGAVSRWRIELPAENNQFDMEALSDVVMHMNYTAREGGEVLRQAANEVAQQNLPGSGMRFFDVRHEFPEVWQRFQSGYHDDESPRHLVLRLGRNMFPFIRCHRDLSILRIKLLFEAGRAIPSTHHTVKFIVNDGRAYLKKEWDECDVINSNCVASADWPCLYHGVLNIPLGPLSGNELHELGTFSFPPETEGISRAFLFCSYQVTRMQPDARILRP